MSTLLKSYIVKTLETSNSSHFVNYLIKLLKMNHLILDSHINRIFKKLNVIEFKRVIFKKIDFISISLESRYDLSLFLNSYLDMHVNVRQFS